MTTRKQALNELADVMEKHEIGFCANNEHDLLDEFTECCLLIGEDEYTSGYAVMAHGDIRNLANQQGESDDGSR